jgi:hypothetical protein
VYTRAMTAYPPWPIALSHKGLRRGRLRSRFNTPPWPRSTLDIHDLIAHGKEHAGTQWLREEVSKVVDGGDKGAADLMVLNQFANEEVPALDVLDLALMLRVVGHINSRFVVNKKIRQSLLPPRGDLLR